MKVWRHLKTDGIYYEVGRTDWETTPVVIYADRHDHRVWVRSALEFDDGRFEFIGYTESVLPFVYPISGQNEANLAPLLITHVYGKFVIKEVK